MPLLHRSKRHDLANRVLRNHDALIRESLVYFERGKRFKKAMREARKAVKKAIKLSKKRKIVTLDEIEKVRHIFQNLRDEIDTTHKALKVTSVNVRNTLTLIQQETIDRPMDLMETARRQFRTKDFAKAMRTLEESRSEIRRRALEKTRAALFGGFSSQIECLRKEL